MAADFSKWRFVLVDRNHQTWLKRAEKELHKKGGTGPVWLDCESVTDSSDKECVYVLESFDCDCYSLLHGKFRVLGAHAVVDHLQRGLPIPPHLSCSQSVYSLAMSNVSITCTSIPREQRTRLYHQVKLLGGQALGDLTVKTTHLICGEVQSLKYKIAVKAGLPIMLPSWVEHVWNTTTTTDEVFHATDDHMMSRHHCGVFQGLVICVTGLDVERRAQVQALAQQHGGVYSGEMKKDECTHLLVDKPEGQKYSYARRWQLATVHSAWFFDSVTAGVCLPEDGYLVTPPPPPSEPGSAVAYSQPWAVELNKFEPSVDLSDTVLDGCKVYFSGFPLVHVEKLTALLHLVGAVRLKQLNAAVTHVLVGQQDQEEAMKLSRMGKSVKVVKVEWLLACCQTGSHVDTAEYEVTLELPQREGEGQAVGGAGGVNVHGGELEENEDDIMQLYMEGMAGGGEEKGDGVLSGRCVAVSELLKEEHKKRVMELLQQLQATVSTTASSSAEYIVTPLFMSKEDYRSVELQGVPVTVCWLERQSEVGSFLLPETHFLFRPICGQISPSALSGCTVYISQYEGLERGYLQTMAGKMGANLSSVFHHSCTHLILKEASGEKYKAALKWKVHTVRDTWVYVAMKQGRRVPECEHAVGVTAQAVEPVKEPTVTAGRTDSKDPPTGTSQLITPFRSLQPKLNTTGALRALQSPAFQEEVNTQQLGAMFSNALAQAADNFGTGDHLARNGAEHNGAARSKGETDLHTAAPDGGPLAGVVIFVSKKLARKQVELHTLVTALGGEFRWTYDSSCTHYIHQGRESDLSKIKELKQARANGCCIVSSHWVRACSEAGSRVQEAQYPCYFNPKRSLSGLAVKRSAVSMSQSSQALSPKLGVFDDETTTASMLQSPTTPDSKVVSGEEDEEGMEGVEPPSTSNDSNTLQMREELQRHVEEMKKQIQEQPRRRSQRLRAHAAEVISAQYRKRKQVNANGSKRRKVSASDEESNSLDGGVKWDTNSQTVTYENPMAKSGQEQIIALIKSAEANNHQTEAMEEGADVIAMETVAPDRTDSLSNDHEVDQYGLEPVDGQGRQEAEVNVDSTPRPPPLGVPIVTTSRGEATRSCVSDVVFEEQPKATGPCTRPLPKKFMFSSIAEEARVAYGELVSKLGGQVLDGRFFNPACTHLVVGKPSRNEKFLAAVAAGKWVLHVSYLESSREAGCFVKEELHEWGGQASAATPSPLEATARKWRIELEGRRKVCSSDTGAFQGWKVILAVDKARLPGMKRLLEAGGAQVIGIRSPYAKFGEATHAFVDFGKLSKLNIDKGDVEKWSQAKVKCLKPEFIAEFLMHGAGVSEADHCVTNKDL